jgi:hypothetical protein
MIANAARIELTPEEREERAALRRRLDRQFGTSATVIPLDHSSQTRKPLGLAPVEGGEGEDEYLGPQATAEKIIAGSLAMLSPQERSAPATMEDLWVYGIGTALEASFDDGEQLRNRLREVRGEIAELKSAQRLEVAELKVLVAELKAEVSALRSIQEGQRIESRGEQGVAGPRGVPGSQGPIGPAGPPGPRGDAAAMIVAWEPTPERYILTPVYATGERGVPANLTGLFEAYHAATAPDDEEA